jgi:hypothetical protein
MTEFKFNQKFEGSTLRLAFEGSIDEDAKFPLVDSAKVQKVFIDMNGVRAINSVGIREWLTWIRTFGSKAEVVFERCPKSIVFQLNMVDGFLPPKATVASFFVPYFCDKCGYEGSHLLTVGKDAIAGPKGVTINFDATKAARCVQEAPCEIEMDVTEAKYFQFLKR